MKAVRFLLVTSILACTTSCVKPRSGPDKTVGNSVLGAAWGAGAGAVVGNQVNNTAEGAGIGAGFGFVNGAMVGMVNDAQEEHLLQQERHLDALTVQNTANSRQLARLQDNLDDAVMGSTFGGFYQVFFDPDATGLKAGATANLEAIAESIKGSPHAYTINVVGHTDDSGNPTYNKRLAESRATTIAGYLASRGVSSDQILISNHGATRPIATNATETGRQLNRRVDIFVTR